jgi:hypothetical protein
MLYNGGVISQLSNSLQPTPFKIQAAVNRQWEKAWKMDPTNIIVSDEDIKKFVGTAEIAAIELFYKTKDNTDFYLGIQFHKGLKNTPTTYDFFNIYFSILKSTPNLSLINVVKLLGERLDNNEELIQMKEPTSIAIGVVDFWMTYGPCTIWKSGEDTAAMNSNILNTKLIGHENLLQNKDNHTGLELIYDGVPKYWFSFQVSQKKEEIYTLQMSMVRKLLSTYL